MQLGSHVFIYERGVTVRATCFLSHQGPGTAVMMEIDHDSKGVYAETIRTLPGTADPSLMMPSEEAVAARLTSPVVTTYIDTNRISFER